MYMDENGDAEGNYTLIALDNRPTKGHGLYPIAYFVGKENGTNLPVRHNYTVPPTVPSNLLSRILFRLSLSEASTDQRNRLDRRRAADRGTLLRLPRREMHL